MHKSAAIVHLLKSELCYYIQKLETKQLNYLFKGEVDNSASTINHICLELQRDVDLCSVFYSGVVIFLYLPAVIHIFILTVD